MTAQPAIAAPSWMTRAEKSDLRRVVRAKKSIGKPANAAETDLIADYVASRSRIVKLRQMLEGQAFCAGQLSVIKAIETATATSRRLARELGLAGEA